MEDIRDKIEEFCVGWAKEETCLCETDYLTIEDAITQQREQIRNMDPSDFARLVSLYELCIAKRLEHLDYTADNRRLIGGFYIGSDGSIVMV